MQRGIALVCVVRENVVDRVPVFADGHRFQLAVLAHEALVAVRAEEHLLAVAQHDRAFGAGGFVAGEIGVCLIVEDHAVDQTFDHRHPLMACGGQQARLGQLDVGVHRSGEEGRLGADGQFAGIERLFDRAVGRGLGDLAQLGRGRVLPFGQSVDLVVEEDAVEIDVAPDGVDEVVAADGQRVAVAGADPDAQVGIGDLDARGHGIGAAVDRVEPEGLHIVDEARRAADARNEDEPVVRRVERIGDFGHGALHGVQHRVVAASGTPFDLLIRFEIGGCVVVCCHNRYFRIVRLSVGSIEPISNRFA